MLDSRPLRNMEHERWEQRVMGKSERLARDTVYKKLRTERDKSDLRKAQKRAEDDAVRAELIPKIQYGLSSLKNVLDESKWNNARFINRSGGVFAIRRRNIMAVGLNAAMDYAEGGKTAHLWFATDGKLYEWDRFSKYAPQPLKTMPIWLLQELKDCVVSS